MVSCSDNSDCVTPSMSKNIDTDFLQKLIGQGENIAYDIEISEIFICDNGSDEWYELSEDINGGDIPYSYYIYIYDGNLYEKFSLMTCSGPLPVESVWNAYCKHTGETRSLYIRTPLNFNAYENTLETYNMRYNVIRFDKDQLIISYDEVTSKGLNRHVISYGKSKLFNAEEMDVLSFGSVYECCLYIAQKGREILGDSFNDGYNDVEMNIVDKWVESLK